MIILDDIANTGDRKMAQEMRYSVDWKGMDNTMDDAQLLEVT